MPRDPWPAKWERPCMMKLLLPAQQGMGIGRRQGLQTWVVVSEVRRCVCIWQFFLREAGIQIKAKNTYLNYMDFSDSPPPKTETPKLIYQGNYLASPCVHACVWVCVCEQLFLPDKLSFSLAVCGYLFTSFNYLKMDFLFFFWTRWW